MAAPYQTLLLDQDAWDLVLDAQGNIALCSAPYALAQDCASAIKTWLAEVWYNTTIGVPWPLILGQFPPLSFVKAQIVAQALTVPGVTAAVCFLTEIGPRSLTGQVQITDEAGGVFAIGFG